MHDVGAAGAAEGNTGNDNDVFAFDGEFFFGWFDRVQAEADNRDYLGIRVREPNDGLWRVDSSINGTDGYFSRITIKACFD